MNDKDIWIKYDKLQTWSTKSRLLRELFYSNEISTLNRLSKELLENTSSSLKDEGIKLIKVLEQKFQTHSKIHEQEYYKSLLAKYKIQSFTNFWFKDFKIIDKSSIFEYLENQIQTRSLKGLNGKFKLEVRFNIGKHLDGYVFTNFGMRKPYEFSHFAYGFITDLVDYYGRMLNDCPNTQNHIQQIPSIPYEILTNKNGIFEFHSKLKEEVNNFYLYFSDHYDSLAQIEINDIPTSSYILKTNELTGDNSNLWTTLSMMNIAKSEKNYQRLTSLARLGKKQIGNRSSGSAWIEYFNKYDN
ncbi:MAG: hypothetical protein IPO26_15075 [Saprospiraceae bacterium]|nr:hypothetical protein [Saprospiraceae bacterium]MBK8827984.1 hypothetical protein [Saprospiraceae bacterium]